jgi:multisubunit Na+/H+ antiporter MnhB subunit
MNSIKRLSAITAITCGALFTLAALMAIWGINPFGPLGSNEVTNKLLPSLALLTVAFLVLFTILKALDEKK